MSGAQLPSAPAGTNADAIRVRDQARAAVTAPGQTRRLTWRWVGAYFGLWLVLSLGAETPGTAELSAALAATIAVSAFIVLWPNVQKELGL